MYPTERRLTRLESCPNIYKTARITACFSVEQAAELVGISVSSLKDYEAYTRIPAICTVDRMCDAYHAPILAYQHNKVISGKYQVAPDVEERDLVTAAVRLVNRVLAFAGKHRDRQLLEIAEDGVIDEEERPLFDAIIQEIRDLIRACTELTLARGGR